MDPGERALRQRAKAMMRKRARAVRSSVPAVGIEARSARICERLLAQPAVTEARALALFWPILRNKEVDLRAVVEPLLRAGKRLAFPRVVAQSEPLGFAWVNHVNELEERGHGFAEPSSTAELASELDVIVVPALLLDGRGHRLGYGAGYYDRTLPKHCPPATALAVAFDFQLALDIPTLEDDVPVNVIVTESRTLDVRSGDAFKA